jgi:serine/threonine protein kinase/tetratricopeptide (TPR) repeat protein
MVDRYVVLDRVGGGGMGVVYAAYDPELDRRIALKLLRPDDAGSTHASEGRARLMREAKATARLQHPNVVAVYDIGPFEDQVFMAMEYVIGSTLADWMGGTARPWREVLDVFAPAGQALAAAHAAGMVHRDFKPDNVIVGRDGRVRVLDFGLARAAKGDPERPSREDLGASPTEVMRIGGDALASPLTQAGALLGTPRYMSPEQWARRATDERSDEFSFCVALYEALYGAHPFGGESVSDLGARVLMGELRHRPSDPAVPGWIHDAVLRGLCADPQERFPSMQELLRALSPPVTRRQSEAPHDDRRRRWERRAPWLVAGFVMVVGVVGAALEARQRASVCAFDPNELSSTWSPSIRAEIRRAFAATSIVDANDIAARATDRVDEVARKWSDARVEVCRAFRVQKREPEDSYRLRTDCLDRQRAEIRAATALFVKADQQVVKNAIDVAYSLPDVTFCADVPTLRASPGLPDDPARRQRAIAIRDRAAELVVLYQAKKCKDGELLGRDLVAEARALGHAPTTARVLFGDAMNIEWLGDSQRAFKEYREATLLALSSRDDVVTVEGAMATGLVLGTRLGRIEEGYTWLDVGRAAIGRTGADQAESLERVLLDDEARIASEGEHQPEKAIPAYEKLVQAYRRSPGPQPETASALIALGVAHDLLGEFAQARPLFKEALEMDRTLYGPAGTPTEIAQYAVAFAQDQLGEPDDGEPRLLEAVKELEARSAHFWAVYALAELTRERRFRGDADGALTFAERGLQLTAADGPVQPIAELDVAAGEVLNDLSRPKEAMPLCERALSAQQHDEALSPERVYVVDALRCRAEALLGLGRPTEATPLLERSLTLKRRTFPGDYARAQFALARALSALHQDPARARDLALAARDELSKYPHLRADLSRVEVFLKRFL